MKFFRILVFLPLIAMSASGDDLAVTIYNSNLGVVSEIRKLSFSEGIDRLAFRDVPSQIDAASVRFDVKGDGKVIILEQNYAYDLVNPAQMYNKYIDKEIELFDADGKLYTGTLLSYSKGEVTLMEKSGRVKIIMLSKISEVSFPSLPEGLITRPTLFWLYQAEQPGNFDCQVSYQTSGMIWDAEYVGILDVSETLLDLSGWASINNTSGKTYENASLKLVAGDIHRAEPEARRGVMKAFATGAPPEVGFQEKEFFEYHLYTLPRKATLANREIKQISLFEPAQASTEKIFVYRPERNPKQVEVALKFDNSSAGGLGMPLPAGRVRLFKADDDGSLILLGEDKISHTPKDEEVTLKVGYAFDIAAEEKLVEQVRVSQQIEDRQFEIEIRNHKKEDIVVKVEKRLYGFWEIIESNLEYDRKDANTVVYHIPVAKDSKALLQYKVRFTSR